MEVTASVEAFVNVTFTKALVDDFVKVALIEAFVEALVEVTNININGSFGGSYFRGSLLSWRRSCNLLPWELSWK